MRGNICDPAWACCLLDDHRHGLQRLVCGGRPGSIGKFDSRGPLGRYDDSQRLDAADEPARVRRRPRSPWSTTVPPRRHRRRRHRASAPPTPRPPPAVPMPGCRTSRSAAVARRHPGQRDAAPRRPAPRGTVPHVAAGAAQPRDAPAEVAGAARDRQHGEADGVASLHDPMSQSSPPAPPESLPAPNTSTAAPAAHPGPARALSPSGHRRHAPLEARGDVGVARCQQRRDHAPLLGGGLDRSPARGHRRAVSSCWSARTAAMLASVEADCSLAAAACLHRMPIVPGGHRRHGDRRRDAVRSRRRSGR